MPLLPPDLYTFLDTLGIAHETLHHPAVFTADDAVDWGKLDAGLHCKNLYVENKEGQRCLVTMPAFARADMNAIGKQLGAGRLSFVKGERMLETLGVPPGSATPFALLNDCARTIGVGLDEAVAAAPRLNVHPLVNTASTVISGADLLKFLAALNITPKIIKTAKAEAA